MVLARACRAFVVFASFARPDRRGYAATAGSSAVYSPKASLLPAPAPTVGGIARATLSLTMLIVPPRRE